MINKNQYKWITELIMLIGIALFVTSEIVDLFEYNHTSFSYIIFIFGTSARYTVSALYFRPEFMSKYVPVLSGFIIGGLSYIFVFYYAPLRGSEEIIIFLAPILFGFVISRVFSLLEHPEEYKIKRNKNKN